MALEEKGSILVVCRANVCRSPVAAFVATRRLEALGISVSSAGSDATPNATMCDHAAAFVATQADGTTAADAHRARDLTASRIAGADLILTASERERSRVAREDPQARERTFTLIEFERLLRLVPVAATPTDLAEVTDLMNRHRWQAVDGRPSRWSALNPWRSQDGLSIRDAHDAKREIHRPVLRRTAEVTSDLVDRLQARLEGSGAARPEVRPLHDSADGGQRHAG